MVPLSVLVPLDSSAASLRAIAVARRLAEGFAVDLNVISWSSTQRQTRRARRRIERHLWRHAIDRPVEMLATGAPNAGIAVAHAATQRRALIVMATSARRGPMRALHGSTAEEVLVHARLPVVLVGPRVRNWAPSGRLVAGIDRSAYSEDVLAPMTDWARDLGMPLELVEVIETNASAPTGVDDADDVYLSSIALGMPTDVTVRSATLHGDVATSLASCTTSADLIAVASHSRQGLARATQGSVTMRLARQASCPVVVIGASARLQESEESGR